MPDLGSRIRNRRQDTLDLVKSKILFIQATFSMSNSKLNSMMLVGLLVFAQAARVALGSTSHVLAERLMAEARASVGILSGQDKIKSLVIIGGFTRIGTARRLGETSKMEKADDVGNMHLSLMLAERFRQDYTILREDGASLVTEITCRDGENVWLANRLPQYLPQQSSIVVRPAPTPDASTRRRIKFAHERYLIALLLYTDASFPISFEYSGKTSALGGRADVLNGRGPDGFEIRLFLSEITHRPLLIAYSDPISGRAEELQIDGYQSTGGVLFPHLLSRVADGKLREEWQLDKFVVNGPLDVRDFQK
jgi:hypothetical protein